MLPRSPFPSSIASSDPPLNFSHGRLAVDLDPPVWARLAASYDVSITTPTGSVTRPAWAWEEVIPQSGGQFLVKNGGRSGKIAVVDDVTYIRWPAFESIGHGDAEVGDLVQIIPWYAKPRSTEPPGPLDWGTEWLIVGVYKTAANPRWTVEDICFEFSTISTPSGTASVVTGGKVRKVGPDGEVCESIVSCVIDFCQTSISYTCCGVTATMPSCYSLCLDVTSDEVGCEGICVALSGLVSLIFTENEFGFSYGEEEGGDGPGWLMDTLGPFDCGIFSITGIAFLYCSAGETWRLEFRLTIGGITAQVVNYTLACAEWDPDGPNVMTITGPSPGICGFPETITVYSCATQPDADCDGDPSGDIETACCPANKWPQVMPATVTGAADCDPVSGDFVYNPVFDRWEFSETCGTGQTLYGFLYCVEDEPGVWKPKLFTYCPTAGSSLGLLVSEVDCDTLNMVFNFTDTDPFDYPCYGPAFNVTWELNP